MEKMEMNFRFVGLALVAILLAFYLGGCSNNQPSISHDMQESFNKIVPDTDLNTHLRLNINDQEKANLNKLFELYLINTSDETIYLDAKQPFRLFIVDNNQWVEIKNKVIYLGRREGGGIYIYPKNSGRDLLGSFVRPELLPGQVIEGDEKILRILVLGETMTDGERTGNLVGAYLDVFIEISP
jgi:hypothetical protein